MQEKKSQEKKSWMKSHMKKSQYCYLGKYYQTDFLKLFKSFELITDPSLMV